MLSLSILPPVHHERVNGALWRVSVMTLHLILYDERIVLTEVPNDNGLSLHNTFFTLLKCPTLSDCYIVMVEW